MSRQPPKQLTKLTKYEETKVLCERVLQQTSQLSDPRHLPNMCWERNQLRYNDFYEIALLELRSGNLPAVVQRGNEQVPVQNLRNGGHPRGASQK